jgi:hypothetical protein
MSFRPWVAITTRRGEPWISIPKLTALPEPSNLAAVEDEVIRRWGTLDLLDVLKEPISSPCSPRRSRP